MSFTVMRYKDGKPDPFKISIWDAFRGAPPPKPRIHKCPQCGKYHTPGTKHEVTGFTQTPKSAEVKATEPPKAEEPPPNPNNFTPEEDAKILEMKAENTSWTDIAKALSEGRTKNMVSSRFKQIKPVEGKSEAKPAGKKAKDDKKSDKSDISDKPFEQMSKDEKRAFKAKQNQEAGLKKREEAKAERERIEREKDKGPADTTTTVTEKTSSVPATTTAPVSESTAKQAALKERNKWITTASKHFDKTGQRITPEQARKMAEETA